MRTRHSTSPSLESSGWSGTFLAARDALQQVAGEAASAAAQLRNLSALLTPGASAGPATPTGPNPNPYGSPIRGPLDAPASNTTVRTVSPGSTLGSGASFAESFPTELGNQMRNWNRLGDRSAQVLASGWAAGVHAVSVELTQAIFVTGQWGDAFVRAGERIVQQLIEVAAQALIVRTLIGVGLGGFLGLANGAAALPAVGHFASGGLNLDTLPALLSPGEAVIRSSAVSRLGPSFLAGINEGVVDLGRLPAGNPVYSTGMSRNAQPGSVGASGGPAMAPHFHFAFHDDGAAARKYLSGVEGRRFLVDSGRQTVHEVTGRS